MNLKSKASIYFMLATGLPLLATVVILYFYLIGGLQRIEIDNISLAINAVKNHFEKEGEGLIQHVARAARADDHRLLQILLTRDRSGQIDQSKLIDITGEYQRLLKLDFLEIISPRSTILASGARPTDFNRPSDFAFIPDIIEKNSVLGFTMHNTGEKSLLSYTCGQTLFYEDSIIAVIVGGKYIDHYYLQNMQLPYDIQLAVLSGKNMTASTLDQEAQALLEDKLQKRDDTDIKDRFRLYGNVYKPYFQNLFSLDERSIYQVMLLYPPSYARLLTTQSLKIYAVVAIAGMIIAGLLGYAFAQRLSSPIKELSHAAERISKGEFERKIIWFSNDELGTLVDGFNHMYDRLQKSQQRLIQAEKLAAWNQMARKIAHEIKNPLTPIKISIEDLRRSYRKNEPDYNNILDNAADTITSEIDKLKRIIDEFSSFARLPAPVLKPINVDKLVKDSLRLYGNLIKEEKIVIETKNIKTNVNADQGLFSQALINLVKNALEADTRGPITISLSREEESIAISVKDRGPGIPEELRSQIFSPYFTTKEKGMGLGLVIAQRIIFDHGGEISVNSVEEIGTEFIIRLPIAG